MGAVQTTAVQLNGILNNKKRGGIAEPLSVLIIIVKFFL